MSNTWFASQRYRLAPAPGSLGLVQDFLNTVGIGDYGPDLLADPELARPGQPRRGKHGWPNTVSKRRRPS